MNPIETSQHPRPITLFTIGFTGHSAEEFFTKLQRAGVKTLFDVRLNNVSQLAGFAKKKDLQFFLKQIAGIEYVHEKTLAPTQDILDAYKKGKMDWSEYELRFNQLLADRHPESHLTPDELDLGCLLCSEHEHQHCHRRLVTEHLERHWPGVKVIHL